jgi:hypothetical protein
VLGKTECKEELFLLAEGRSSLTRGQVNNLKWHEAKHERLTSSNFGVICKMKENTKPENTI